MPICLRRMLPELHHDRGNVHKLPPDESELRHEGQHVQPLGGMQCQCVLVVLPALRGQGPVRHLRCQSMPQLEMQHRIRDVRRGVGPSWRADEVQLLLFLPPDPHTATNPAKIV